MSSLHQLLKTKTHAIHTLLEQQSILKNYVSPTLTMEGYKTLMALQWRAYSCWQNQLNHLAYELNFKNNFLIKLNADLMKSELKKLRYNPSLPKPEPLLLTNIADYLGCAYVFEGAKLGSKIIYKSLLANKNFRAYDFTYFKHVNENSYRWQHWINQLAAFTKANDIDPERVSDSAKLCFRSIYYWFKN